MSTSKQNLSDSSKPVSALETRDHDPDEEQSLTTTLNTQQQKENTQISSKTSSHDNEDDTKDDSSKLLLKDESKETEKDKSPINRSITATVNKVSPLPDISGKNHRKGIYLLSLSRNDFASFHTFHVSVKLLCYSTTL